MDSVDSVDQSQHAEDAILGSAEPLSPEQIAERLRQLATWGVDLSLIRASLERTPTERLAHMQELADFIELMRRAYRNQRGEGMESKR